MKLPRLAVKYARITVTATLANGTPATINGVDVAVVSHTTTPDQFTTWAATTYSGGVATILLAGPYVLSPPGGALVVTQDRMSLWARITDTPEVDLAFIDEIDFI